MISIIKSGAVRNHFVFVYDKLHLCINTFTITFNILFQIVLSINKGKYYHDCDKDDGTVRMGQ